MPSPPALIFLLPHVIRRIRDDWKDFRIRGTSNSSGMYRQYVYTLPTGEQQIHNDDCVVCSLQRDCNVLFYEELFAPCALFEWEPANTGATCNASLCFAWYCEGVDACG